MTIGALTKPVWVKRVGLTTRRSRPVFTYEPTFVDRADWSVSCHKPTSLERPETNTLSVGAYIRVEAKGMPKVK
jgi:hypothetical protein